MKSIFPQNNEKITEKSFSQGLLVSVLCIFLCIVALCSITYAWFTTNAISGENKLASGHFSLDIQVNDGAVPLTDHGDGSFSCTLDAAGTYTVTLKVSDSTTATKGFCDVVINSTDKRQTELLSGDPAIGVNPLIFTIEVDSPTTLTFVPKWGMPANAEITNASLIELDSTPATPDPADPGTEVPAP